MSSRPERRWRKPAAALLLAAAASFAAAQGGASAPAATFGAEAVQQAVASLRAERPQPKTHTERQWRWKDDETHTEPRQPPPWLQTLLEIANWLAAGGRGAVWLLGALAVAMIAVLFWRALQRRGAQAGARALALPESVAELDIRPQSLPDAIGAAALALWQRGEHRAALSLLYRGALSRLVHDRGVAIRSASTEGECLRLGRAALAPAAADFFERLVRSWQSEVYADRRPESASVAALCEQFDRHLGPAPDGAPR